MITRRTMKLASVAASLFLSIWVGRVEAVLIPIQNHSFESPLPPDGQTWLDGMPTGWSGSPPDIYTWIENNASLGFTGGDGAQSGGIGEGQAGNFIYQDLGVPFKANMTYRVDIAGAHRSNTNHALLEFGVFSSNAIGTVLGNAGFIDLQGVWTGAGNPDGDDQFDVLRDASFLNTLDVNGDGVGSLGRRSRFDAGDTPPSGNIVVFIRHGGGGNRIQYDNIRLDESPSLLRGDVDLDGDVDLNDLATIRANFRLPAGKRSLGDLDEDNFVGIKDYLEWRSNFPFPGAGAGANVGVPEPSAGILALLALFVLCSVRRRMSGVSSPALLLFCATALLLAASLRMTGTASGASLGLNFAATDPDAATSSLLPAEIAGVVPQANWNNLEGAAGTGVGGLVKDNGSASSATVTWTSPNTWRSGGNNGFPAGPDRKLTSGYIDTGNTTATGITLTVNNIDLDVRTPAYNVYVYFVSDSGANRGGGYTINDGNVSVLKYGSTMAMPSMHVKDPGTDVDNSLDGTYLQFTGLTGSSFTLTTDTTLTTPNGFRAPINAIQIVPGPLVLPGDVNGDGNVDLDDFALIRDNFQKSVTARNMGDLNEDGFVDFIDFRQWKANYSPGSGSNVSVPEPATWMSGLACLLALSGIRQKRLS